MELPYKWMAWSLGRPVSSTNIFVHFMLVSERICRCLFPPKVGRMTQVGCFHWCGSLLRLSHCVGGIHTSNHAKSFLFGSTGIPFMDQQDQFLFWMPTNRSNGGLGGVQSVSCGLSFLRTETMQQNHTPDLSAVKVFHHTCATRV